MRCHKVWSCHRHIQASLKLIRSSHLDHNRDTWNVIWNPNTFLFCKKNIVWRDHRRFWYKWCLVARALERAAGVAGVSAVFLVYGQWKLSAVFLTCPLLSISSFRVFVLQGRRGHQFSTCQIENTFLVWWKSEHTHTQKYKATEMRVSKSQLMHAEKLLFQVRPC